MFYCSVPVLEAVGHQLSFGEVVEPGELPAAVSAGVERREALVAPLQLHREREREGRRGALEVQNEARDSSEGVNYLTASHLRGKGEGAGLLERPRAGAQHLDTEVH